MSSSILCLEAVGVPVEPAPAWYTYPRIKRVPWGKNMGIDTFTYPIRFKPEIIFELLYEINLIVHYREDHVPTTRFVPASDGHDQERCEPFRRIDS